MLDLPRLVGTKVRGKSNQDTLVVVNSTPEINEDTTPFESVACHRESSLHLERLGGTIREQCCGQKQKVVCCPRQWRHA